jgi:hypothetical protein
LKIGKEKQKNHKQNRGKKRIVKRGAVNSPDFEG